MDYKEMLVYLAIAVVVIIAVVLFVGKGLVAPNYNVSVTLYSIGANPIYPYQTSHFVINVTNHGGSPISNLLVGFYLDGSEISSNSVTIPAGQSALLIRNYTYASPGAYGFEAVADPGHIMQIQNRNATQSEINYNISQTEPANPYSSIPENGMNETQSFTLSGTGVVSSVAVATKYNVSLFTQLFGPGGAVPLKIAQNLYDYIAYSNGAYSTYSNGSVAYSNWLQGTVNPSLIKFIVTSFGISTRQAANNVSYAVINNKTSMCYFYQNGWTKIISYYNNSAGTTCLNVVANSYPYNESNIFIDALRNNSTLTHYQSEFFYTNVTTLGTVLGYSKQNVTATNIFYNNVGLFASSVTKLNKTLNTTARNYTCEGLIYNSSNASKISICSYIIPPITGNVQLTYGLVNSTYILPNYIFNLYSLVNQSELVSAHDNAAKLISFLNANGISVQWQSAFTNTCELSDNALGCKLLSFDYSINNATLNITNNLNSTIKLNQINCEESPGFPNMTINQSIPSNSGLAVSMHCNIIPVPLGSSVSSYTLLLNYTYHNTTNILNGYLNISTEST